MESSSSILLFSSLMIAVMLLFVSSSSTFASASIIPQKSLKTSPLVGSTICQPGANFANKDFVCNRLLEESKCGYDHPILCAYPDPQTEFLCLNESQIQNENRTCNGGCYDFRACGTKSCNRQCSKQECNDAFSVGKVCPSQGEDPREHFICTSGTIKDFCGYNNDQRNGPECDEGYKCLVNNSACGSCCDFNSCKKYESCFDVDCPTQICDEFAFGCAWQFPFFCYEGQAFRECSPDPDYFHKKGCSHCCDLNNCLPMHCGVCPADMCGGSSSTKDKKDSKVISNNNNATLLSINECPKEAPVMCLNSLLNPQNIGKCALYGYWPSHRDSCDECCACP